MAHKIDLAADVVFLVPGITSLDHDTSSLDAAAEQLQAVCRQLLQGLAISDDLQSSIDQPHEAAHDAFEGKISRSTDVLAGLVSELEAGLASSMK